MAKMVTPREALNADQQGSLKSYEIGLDADGQPVSKFKYLEGHPRQIRFDAKEGKFKLHMGGEQFKDMGRSITFRPLAWRIFYDPNLFNRGPKRWAELFFVDANNAICAVMFHEYSVDNLEGLIEPLFYEDQTLADVTLTVTADKKSRQDGGTYYIATFSFTLADQLPQDLSDYLKNTEIYRRETLTEVSEVSVAHGMKYIVRPHVEPAQLEAPAETK
ncbi:hypothetical protein [Spirosoma aerophilum]